MLSMQARITQDAKHQPWLEDLCQHTRQGWGIGRMIPTSKIRRPCYPIKDLLVMSCLSLLAFLVRFLAA